MRTMTKKAETSDFYCTKCGHKGIPIIRPSNKFREAGHLKELYCPHCGEMVNHCEVRPRGKYTYEDFREEFELGRFFDGNRLPVAKLPICECENCKYNKKGKCWNTNHSYDCEMRKENVECLVSCM